MELLCMLCCVLIEGGQRASDRHDSDVAAFINRIVEDASARNVPKTLMSFCSDAREFDLFWYCPAERKPICLRLQYLCTGPAQCLKTPYVACRGERPGEIRPRRGAGCKVRSSDLGHIPCRGGPASAAHKCGHTAMVRCSILLHGAALHIPFSSVCPEVAPLLEAILSLRCVPAQTLQLAALSPAVFAEEAGSKQEAVAAYRASAAAH